MHCIIAMSPLGGVFRSRLLKFPSLVNCCTIDWFAEWPEEALLSVGRGQIEDGEIDSLEWDVETDGEYTSSYGSYASVSFYYDPEEWKIDPRVLFQILDSRDFKILLRDNMLAVPRKQMPTDYYLDIARAYQFPINDELGYLDEGIHLRNVSGLLILSLL